METRSTDAEGRVSLPEAFANATVTIELVSDTEIRIRKAVAGPDAEYRFREESVGDPLSDRDRDRFLDLLDHPLSANPSLKGAAAKRADWHG